MNQTTKKLRPYQVRLITDVCRAREDVLVEQPTGSGKTVQIVTLVAMHLGRRFTHALISAPQEQIEQGFVQRDYQVIAFPVCPGVAVPPIQTPAALIKGARESRLGSVKRVIHYLRQPGPLDHAFACTHAALNRLTADDLPENLSGKALFIDEAHHASADGLSQIVALWRERGGQLFFFTATPYRGDGRPVRLDGMRTYRRSLAEHMAEGFAPGHLESEIVALGQPGDVITAGQFTGEEAPPSSYFDGLVAAICRRWLEDGKPKTIVRVPSMKGGRSGELVSRLMQALASHGARVLDATGTGAADKQRFLNGLEDEKNRTYTTSGFDVMVGIQRVLEGTDWPVCSAVYCVGMPGSLNTVVQFLGRAMRLKGEDYPAEQRDRAGLVFFVPCGGGAALADLSLDHSRHALLTCCFLADHEVGQEWIVLREMRRGIESALGKPTENPTAADAENEADEPLGPEIRAEIELVMADVREQITSRGGEPTVGEVVEWVAKTRPDLPEDAVHRVASEILAAQTTSIGKEVRDTIQREVAKRLRIDPMVKKAMAEAFAVVLDQFRDATLEDSVVLESVGRQIHGITGGQMREFAQRLRDATPRPLTEEQVLTWADAYHRRMSSWPGQESGEIAEAPGETWLAVDIALRQGCRGFSGGSSLARILAEHRGVRNKKDLPSLSVEQILAWADAYRKQHGQWPKYTAGPVMDSSGETWSGVNTALFAGIRGLPGGSSLAKLLAECRGLRHIRELPPFTTDEILGWADAYFQRHGSWPSRTSGPIPDATDETWGRVNGALIKGLRGLPGGISLAQLLADCRGVRNIGDLRDLTEDQILVWADAQHQRTGEWPTGTSGDVVDAPGESWSAISQALEKGVRGLAGGSSLARLLSQKRGVRNIQDLPDLTVEQILCWADAHLARTDTWPSVDSGPVVDSPGDKWANIHQALSKGHRGLPGGSSLAQLLFEQRGIRNIQQLPLLTVEQILAWADAHHQRAQQWPLRNSGPVFEVPGETWNSVDAALRKGSRGLPDNSSLSQLLRRERGVRTSQDAVKLTEEMILTWIDSYHECTGLWPKQKSGPIAENPDDTWRNVDNALRLGLRGLPGGSSLAQVIKEHRRLTTPNV